MALVFLSLATVSPSSTERACAGVGVSFAGPVGEAEALVGNEVFSSESAGGCKVRSFFD